MIVRRNPAIVLSSVLSAAALVLAPPALASDGGVAKDFDRCSQGATTKLKVDLQDNNRLKVVGIVWSPDDDVWDWAFRHEGDVSADGSTRARDDIDRSLRIVRTMVNWPGTDRITFRAENRATGEVCRVEVDYP